MGSIAKEFEVVVAEVIVTPELMPRAHEGRRGNGRAVTPNGPSFAGGEKGER